MHVQTLTLKGFKSFADPVTLAFEPGITVVVGPNGSGKSNVVDALAWVLGAQSPRTLRSQRMDDVIFAGTTGRPALGRAEVSLVIDNSDGTLAHLGPEISIRRTLQRGGESGYYLNGAPCRLLDIQELLGDVGVGRTQHLLVGQGQLDEVLEARPAERRAAIEEAAGILKHRARRERAERRLAAAEADVALAERELSQLASRLRPLRAQADAARRRAVLEDERSLLRHYLVGLELLELDRALGQAEAEAARARHAEEAAALAEEEAVLQLKRASAEYERRAGAATARELLGRVGALGARAEAARRVVAERLRGLDARVVRPGERELAQLQDEQQAVGTELGAAREEEQAVEAELRVAEDGLAALELARTAWLAAQPAPWQQRLDDATAMPLRPASPARLAPGGPDAGRPGASGHQTVAELDAALEELGRSLSRERARAMALERERAALLARRTDLLASSEVLDPAGTAPAHDAAVDAQRAAEAALEAAMVAHDAATARHRDREAEQLAAVRTAEALSEALEAARRAAGLGQLERLPGVLGAVVDLVDVEGGLEAAVRAALLHVLDLGVVANADVAVEALSRFAAAGRAGGVVVLDGPAGQLAPRAPREGAGCPAGDGAGRRVGDGPGEPPALALRGRVRGVDERVDVLLDAWLVDVYLVEGGWERAVELYRRHPTWVVVTRAGDCCGPAGWRVGGDVPGVTAATVAAAVAAADEAARRGADASVEVAAAADVVAEAERRVAAAARAAAEAVEAHRSAVALRAELDASVAALDAEHARVEGELSQCLAFCEDERRRAEALESTRAVLAAAMAAEEQQRAAHEEELRRSRAAARATWEAEREAWQRDGDSLERERAVANSAAEALRARRAAVRERVRLLERRRADLEGRWRQLEGQLRRADRGEALAKARRAGLEALGAHAERLVRLVAHRTTQLEEDARALEARVARSRSTLEACRQSLEDRRRASTAAATTAARATLDATEAKMRIEAAERACLRELGADPGKARADAGGQAPHPDPAARLQSVERALGRLGAVNPLAAEELAELEERAALLEAQAADVRAARRELRRLTAAIDREIEAGFAAAWVRVSEHFAAIVAALFPGGSGALRLVGPEGTGDRGSSTTDGALAADRASAAGGLPTGDGESNADEDGSSTKTGLASGVVGAAPGVEIEVMPAGKRVRKVSLLSGGERSLAALAFVFALLRACPGPFYLLDEVEAALDDVSLCRFLDLLADVKDDAQVILVSHQRRTMAVADRLYGVTLQPGGSSRVVSQRVEAVTSSQRPEAVTGSGRLEAVRGLRGEALAAQRDEVTNQRDEDVTAERVGVAFPAR